MSTPTSAHHPNPAFIFETLQSYQRSAALKAAIDLDLFTAIGKGNHTAEAIANAVGASLRGTRILCDYLTIHGFLTKEDGQYSPVLEASLFLDKSSHAYFGSVAQFLLDPRMMAPFSSLTEVVRNGRTTLPEKAR